MLNMVGIGIPNQGTMVTAIKALPIQLVQQFHIGTQPVIGYFKHYVNDVRTYRFSDKYNHIFSIHATPNHPFWIKNLHIFLPITDVTSRMTLLGDASQPVHLICPNDQPHCGKPYHKGKVFAVYNIEVYKQHVYRVGQFDILVHNKNELFNNGAIGMYDQLLPGEFIRARMPAVGYKAHDFIIGRLNNGDLLKTELTIHPYIDGHLVVETRIIPASLFYDLDLNPLPTSAEIPLNRMMNEFMPVSRRSVEVSRAILSLDTQSLLTTGISNIETRVTRYINFMGEISDPLIVNGGNTIPLSATGLICGINCRVYSSMLMRTPADYLNPGDRELDRLRVVA